MFTWPTITNTAEEPLANCNILKYEKVIHNCWTEIIHEIIGLCVTNNAGYKALWGNIVPIILHQLLWIHSQRKAVPTTNSDLSLRGL